MQKPGKEMELRTLNKRHAFGIKADVYGCIHWLDENTLLYPVGRNVVMHNVQSNAQKFFLTSEKAEAITAIALSPNKKWIAIAESGDQPQIQIVDTTSRKRRRVLNSAKLGSDRFVCVQFSGDGRHLLTQGGAPNWNLVFWNFEQQTSRGNVEIQRDPAAGGSKDSNFNLVTHVSCNPRDPFHFVVSGNGLFRFYRHQDGGLKPANKEGGMVKQPLVTTHAWVTEERIVVALDNFELILIEGGEYRCPLPVSANHSIYAIVPTSKGFVCGGEMGMINIFEATDDGKELYKKVQTLTIEPRGRDVVEDSAKKCTIRAFALTHGEDMLAIATSTLQIYTLNFNVHDWSKPDTPPVFHSIVQPFHAGPIVGLDTCVRKPLVATSSTDKTVRIWNTQEHTVEIVKSFASEPGAIALHPSGLHILVCFADRVRFMNLYGDNIQEFKAFNIRSVSEVKFSVGGQYFAVAHMNIIMIYNTATCDTTPIGQLRGHSQRVKSLQWCATTQFPTDTRLVSCSMDGTVIDWNLKEMRKESDHIDKHYQYHAVASDDKNIWAVGAPASSQSESKWKVKLREIEVNNMHGDTIANDYEFPDIFMNTLSLAPQHRLLFGGCTDGSVKLMTFPLQGGIHDPPILAHAGPVTKMAISYDESMLFTAGADGSLYLFDIKEDGRTTKRETNYADEILISKVDLEDKTNTAARLATELEDVRLDIEYQDKRTAIEQHERIKEEKERAKEEIDKQKLQYKEVQLAKIEQEKSFTDQKKEKAEEHRESLKKLEKQKQTMLEDLNKSCDAHRENKKQLEKQHLDILKTLADENERRFRDQEEAFQAEMQALRDKYQQQENILYRTEQTQKETRLQLERDTDAELVSMKEKYDAALRKVRDEYIHLRGDNAIERKKCENITKEIDAKDAEIAILEASKQKLLAQATDLGRAITKLHTEIDERDLTIGEKEKKIYDLKKRNQDLEKHKFVLDHKIRDLKSQIEPKQMEIAKENEKIKVKDAELEQAHKNNLALRTSIEDLKSQIASQQNEIKHLLNRLKDFETYKSRVKTDVGELAQLVQDPEQLRQGIAKMFQEHVVARGGKRCASLEPELKQEFSTHTEFLAKTVESLKRKVTSDQDAHKREISSVMAENLQLIAEIHQLRKEIRNLRNTGGGDASAANTTISSVPAVNKEAQKEIEVNRVEIQRLRSKIDELEKSLTLRARPGSRERPLPPVGQ